MIAKRIITVFLVFTILTFCWPVLAQSHGWKWSRHGGDPYYKRISSLEDLVSLSEKPGLYETLMRMGLTDSGADLVQRRLANPTEGIYDVDMPIGMRFYSMATGHGVKGTGVVEGNSEEAIEIPISNGFSVYVPLVCGNLTLAESAEPAPVIRRERPVSLRPEVGRTKAKKRFYKEPWFWAVVGGVATLVIIGTTRHHRVPQKSGGPGIIRH